VLFPRLSWKFDDGDELNVSGGVQSNRNGWDGARTTTTWSAASPTPITSTTVLSLAEQHDDGAGRSRLDRENRGRQAGPESVGGTQPQRQRPVQRDVHRGPRPAPAARLGQPDPRPPRSLRGKYTRSLFDGHSLSAGLETSVQESEQTRDRHDQLNQDAPTRIIETFAPKITRLAGYAQDEWSIDKQLSVYLGARWEGVQTDSDADGRP
jgi:outer membrane receptor for ferrienterochelin and colicins